MGASACEIYESAAGGGFMGNVAEVFSAVDIGDAVAAAVVA